MAATDVDIDYHGRGLQSMELLDLGKPGLRSLRLDHNNLHKIEGLEKATALRELSLANNRLLRIDGLPPTLIHLRVLILSNNSISRIDSSALRHLVQLEYLDLSNNNIKRIENLQYNINLIHLDLSHNNISALGPSYTSADRRSVESNTDSGSGLRNLRKLQTLLLRGNLISSLDHVASYLPAVSLKRLSLAQNELTEISSLLHLAPLAPTLQELDIDLNPLVAKAEAFQCDYRPLLLYLLPNLSKLNGIPIGKREIQASRTLFGSISDITRVFHTDDEDTLITQLASIAPLGSLPAIDSPSPPPSKYAKQSPPHSDLNPPSFELQSHRTLRLQNTDSRIAASNPSLNWDTEMQKLSSEVAEMRKRVAASTNGSIAQIRDTKEIPLEQQQPPRLLEIVTRDELVRLRGGPPRVFTRQSGGRHAAVRAAAATIIQAHVRGFLTRKTYRKFLQQHLAATKIQAAWRGMRVRRTIGLPLRSAANGKTMHNVGFGDKDLIDNARIADDETLDNEDSEQLTVTQLRERLADEIERRLVAEEAVREIWNEVRVLRMQLRRLMDERETRAAVTLQRHWRGRADRRLADLLKRQMATHKATVITPAVVAVQKWVRGWLARRRYHKMKTKAKREAEWRELKAAVALLQLQVEQLRRQQQ